MTTPPDTKLLRELARGRIEWQVMNRDETAFVLACDFEHEAQRWVDEQPPERIVRTGYHVVRQVVLDRRDTAILALCDAHDRLLEEAEGLRADAGRYRWLREQHWSSSSLAVVVEPKVSVKLGHDCPFGERLDAAIDAAISATKDAT